MKRIRPVDFDRLKELISPYEVLSLDHWVPTWRRGDIMRGPCPVHGSRRPNSRSLAVMRTGWYCHYCHQRGDAVALYALRHDLTMLQSALELCRIFRIEVPRL